jgi:N-acylglucosamine 2-epimerase
MNNEQIAELAQYYRKHLLEEVMPFWEQRTADKVYGGYLTGFDRSGNPTDTDKYLWLQARQMWIFSALYNHIDKRSLWLDLARHGREFLLSHAYAGNGRWNYRLDREGNVKVGAVALVGDCFALEALCEFAVASGAQEDIPIIHDTFSGMSQRAFDPRANSFPHFAENPGVKRHGIYFVTLRVSSIAERLLGLELTQPLIDRCLQEILYGFASDEHELLFENIAREGGVLATREGRLINPGHMLESMWFCLEEAKKKGSRRHVDRAIQIIDWAYACGYDKEHGGILSFIDSTGQQPDFPDWLTERNIQWYEKAWWVHAEALYALALAALESDSPELMNRFLELHSWCREYFYDHECGEWYLLLHRDGKPRIRDKGGMQKCAYHLPRALIKLVLLFEDYLTATHLGTRCAH